MDNIYESGHRKRLEMMKKLLDSFEAIKDSGEARDQIFATEPVDMVVPCVRGLSSPRIYVSYDGVDGF